MAGYNPLSYFSFGKKKDSSEVAESPEQLERSSARSSAHADRRGGDDAGECRAAGTEHAGGCRFTYPEPRSAPGCFVASRSRFVEARSPHVMRVALI